MTAAAPLIDRLLCGRCGWARIGTPCPCQTRTHAHRIRTEAAQRAEEAARYYLRGRRRTRRTA